MSEMTEEDTGSLSAPAVDTLTEGQAIAARSQDETKASATAHRKEFVVLKSAWGTTDKTDQNRANVEATRQAMIHQGLRPTGDGRYVSQRAHPDGVSLVLVYEVPCETAAEASDPLVEGAHVTLDDQAAAEAATPEASAS